MKLSRALVAAAAVAVIAALLGSGCASPAPGPPAPPTSAIEPMTRPAPLGPDDWPTYHHDNARSGVAPHLAPLTNLAMAWRTTLDGAVYGQPLVLGERVIAATENNTVYALDARDGHIMWSTSLGPPQSGSGLPCGDMDPLGITGTAAYDEDSGLVFVVAETSGGQHTLVGIDAVSGAVVLRRAVPPPRGQELAHQQRSALTVLDGWAYVAYGGLYGDCGDYIGSVVAAPTRGLGPLRDYAVPTSREAGIWAPSGASVQSGHLLYAVGNGESTGDYDHSDAVLALTPELTLVDSFSPAEWAADNADDLDLGSMGPVVVGNHVLADGKRGLAYLLDGAKLGGIGGQLTSQPVCDAYGGSAVLGSMVYLPCSGGVRAVAVDQHGGLRQLWKTSVSADGSPVVGGGAVWAADTAGGVLYALDADSGRPLRQIDVGALPHFASPTLSGNRAYLGTMRGVVAISGA